MSGNETGLLWNQPDWNASARDWIEATLHAAGQPLTGSVDQFHTRIWSTVMRCPTAAGTVYFKACQRLTEPRLTLFLSQVQPENLPRVLAVDLERGWLLMRDEGPMLRAYLKTPADLALFEPALRDFARLQLAATEQAGFERLFALGAQDRRLERLPDLYASLLADEQVLRLGAQDGLAAEEVERLRAGFPRYAAMCAELRGCGVPQTLFHDDFHDGNIFISGEARARRFTFSDWDESCVGHPFFSIMLCLRSAGSRAGFPDEATEAPERMPPELNRLRDVYLEPWQRFESQARLVEIFNLAWRVGMVSRALTWRDYVASLEESQRGEFAYIVPAWLQEFLLAG